MPTTNSHLRSSEKWMGAQRMTKVALRCKYCSCCSWWKGTSQDKATLINEEIKLVALASLKLYLSEGINKSETKLAVSRKSAK